MTMRLPQLLLLFHVRSCCTPPPPSAPPALLSADTPLVVAANLLPCGIGGGTCQQVFQEWGGGGGLAVSGRGCSERTRLRQGVSQPLEFAGMMEVPCWAFMPRLKDSDSAEYTQGQRGSQSHFPFHTHRGTACSHCNTAGTVLIEKKKDQAGERKSLWFTSHLFVVLRNRFEMRG